MEKKICYLVGASELNEKPKDGFVIAADGGLDRLIKMGVKPDLLIGDMDSVRCEIPSDIPCKRFKKEKDETDMYLAYLEGVKLGYTSFVILGGGGGRLDHTLANHALLLHAAKRGHRMEMADAEYLTTVVYNSSIEVHLREEAEIKDTPRYVSIFAIGADAKSVKIKGLYYEVDGVDISCDFPVGVSNCEKDQSFLVGCEDGALMVMVERRGLASLL